MSKNQFKLISFAEINRLRDDRGELVLSQGDKQWLRSELKQIAYVLDLTITCFCAGRELGNKARRLSR